MLSYEENIRAKKKLVENYLESYLNITLNFQFEPMKNLSESIRYSVLNGGKRFRPILSLLVAEIFSVAAERILPFAIAVEMIHSYSLAHDDLPCMDNDDMRRGKPTNHKVFGESIALLAGDALLTESFQILSTHYRENSFLALEIIDMLSKASGAGGMVGGQAIDLSKNYSFDFEKLKHLHLLKTGALIKATVEGAALLSGATFGELENLKMFGESVGLAFQINDDLLDAKEEKEKHKSYVGLLGEEKTKSVLKEVSQKGISYLHRVTKDAIVLEKFVELTGE